MRLKYTVSFEIIFDVPDDISDSEMDELGQIAESFVNQPTDSWDLEDLEFSMTSPCYEFWGEVESVDE
jgi:hypothetical protein